MKHFFTILCICFFVKSFAADITNVNTSGTYQWNNAATWVGGIVPGASDNVILRGASGGITIQVPGGTFSCINLTLPNSINLSLVLQTNAILQLSGSIIKQGSTFGTNMITSGSGSASTGGRIRFVGNSRDIAPNSNTDVINNYGIRDQINNWICEIGLTTGQTATMGSLSDFKCGRFILTSGNCTLPTSRTLLVDRNSTGVAGAGTDGLGSISIATGCTLITDNIGRRTSSTTYIGPVSIDDGGVLTLRTGGQGAINGETITVNGTLQLNGTTTVLSACSSCTNGTGISGVTFGSNATLMYNIPASTAPGATLVALGAIIDRAGSGNTVNTLTVNTLNTRDRLLTTQTVGLANFANSIKVNSTLNLNGKIEIGATASEKVELLQNCNLTGASTSNYVLITSRTGTGQKGLMRYVNNSEASLFPVALKASGTIERFTPFILTNNGSAQVFSFSNMEPDSWALNGGVNATLFPLLENNFNNADFNNPSTNKIVASDMIQDVRWDIDASLGTADVNMKVGFGSDVTIGSGFASNLSHYIFHNTGVAAPAKWTEHSATYTATDASLFNLPTLTGIYNGGFSPFAFGSKGVVLPIILHSFTVTPQARQNSLTWVASTDRNTISFEVQKSENGVYYKTIGLLNTQQNTGAALATYNFNDVTPSNTNYYRLKIIEANGSYEYSKVLHQKRGTGLFLNVFPNPAQDYLTISFNIARLQTKEFVQVINSAGRIVKSLELPVLGNTNFKINIQDLSAGMYTLRIVSTGETQTFVKQ